MLSEIDNTTKNVTKEYVSTINSSVKECEDAIQIVKNHIAETLSKLFPREVFDTVIKPNLYYTDIKDNDGNFICHVNNSCRVSFRQETGRATRGDMGFRYTEIGKPIVIIEGLVANRPSENTSVRGWLLNTVKTLEQALNFLEVIENNVEHIYGEIKRQADKKTDAKKESIKSMCDSTAKLKALVGKVSEPKEPVGKTINITINL